MNSSSHLMMRFYLTMMDKFNLTHLLEPGMNTTQLAKMLEDNFPWPPDMLFTSANVISITVYTVQLVVGLAANCYSLVHLLRERLVQHNKNRMILLLIHLTCADLCVSFDYDYASIVSRYAPLILRNFFNYFPRRLS